MNLLLTSFAELLQKILTSTGIQVTMITFAATVLIRTGLKIFNLGVNSKSKMATKEDLLEFKKEIRTDLINYKSELRDICLKQTVELVNQKTKNIDDIYSISSDMRVAKEVIENRCKEMDKKTERLDILEENVKELQKQINTVKYGSATTTNGRRSE